MTCRSALAICLCLFAASCVSDAYAQPITVLNPGGELYDTTAGNFAIPESPVPPADGTGWNATSDTVPGDRGVEGIPNNPQAGANRLAFGAIEASEVAPEDAILYQLLDHEVAMGEEFILSFYGRGFFAFTNDTDDLASFFGYIDGSNNLVQVDTHAHTSIVSGSWTQTGHSFIVPGGSPLIGQDLVIGFFTQTLDGGGFASIDEVSLMLGAGNPACDATGDGLCTFADVEMIADNFLENVTIGTMGDLDDNGVVNFLDFRIWKDASGFGGTFAEALAAANAPEPGTLSLLGTALLGTLWGTRRRKRG